VAVLSVHIEGGKRFHSGVLIDITGDAGDLRITNTSAFGGVNEGYQVSGGQAGDTASHTLPLPESYVRFPETGLATGIAEVGDLFIAYAEDVANGTTTVPTFADAVWLQNLFTQFIESQETGRRVTVPAPTSKEIGVQAI
jgi:predicted dehydrogenase